MNKVTQTEKRLKDHDGTWIRKIVEIIENEKLIKYDVYFDYDFIGNFFDEEEANDELERVKNIWKTMYIFEDLSFIR